MGGGQHQLDSVQLVHLAGAGVIVYGDDVGAGILPAQLLDDALAHDVVGQAAEGLGADDILHAGVNQFQHLAGEEPSLAGLVAQGDKILGHGGQIGDLGLGGEMAAGLQLLPGGPAEILQQGDAQVAQPCGGALAAQVIRLEVAVVEAVQQEIHQVRHHGLGPLGLKQF